MALKKLLKLERPTTKAMAYKDRANGIPKVVQEIGSGLIYIVMFVVKSKLYINRLFTYMHMLLLLEKTHTFHGPLTTPTPPRCHWSVKCISQMMKFTHENMEIQTIRLLYYYY